MPNLLRAALKELSKAGPKTLYHGSDNPWIALGKSPNLDAGEGFGLHMGTRAQAKDRLGVPALIEMNAPIGLDTIRAGRLPALGIKNQYLDKVTMKRGRQIELPDLESWAPSNLLYRIEGHASGSRRIKGLSDNEGADLARILRREIAKAEKEHGFYAKHDAKITRDALRNVGVQRVKYKNDYEGTHWWPLNYSYAALDPNIIRPHSIAYRLSKAAGAGGALGVLFPHETSDADLPASDGLPVDRDGGARPDGAVDAATLRRALRDRAQAFAG